MFPWAPSLGVQAGGKSVAQYLFYGIIFLNPSLSGFIGLLHELKWPPPAEPQWSQLFTWDNFPWHPEIPLGLPESSVPHKCTLTWTRSTITVTSGWASWRYYLSSPNTSVMALFIFVLIQLLKKNQDPISSYLNQEEFSLTVAPGIGSYLEIHSLLPSWKENSSHYPMFDSSFNCSVFLPNPLVSVDFINRFRESVLTYLFHT